MGRSSRRANCCENSGNDCARAWTKRENRLAFRSVTKFSINLNKIALLRNSRGGNRPDLLSFAKRCVDLGVHGITVHPRPDARHTRYADVVDLARMVRSHSGLEFNVEGNPIPSFVELVLEVKPDQVTLVPDVETQLTSDHGWDAVREESRLGQLVETFRAARIRTSLFLDPDTKQVEAAARTGAERIELYTESYASAFGGELQDQVVHSFRQAAGLAGALGLGVNAGHDLSLDNLEFFLQHIPNVLEVSVGHAVICEALFLGLETTVARYLKVVGAS